MKTRTRYAPSPTGFMHIGNLRTAIFEYLVAKQDKGDFILRIEDTDQERQVEGAIDFIYDTLSLCKFEIDEGPNNPGEYGPYVQSERKAIYKEYAEKLVEMGHAYYCFCTAEELDDQRKIADENKVPFLYDGRCSKLSKEEVEAKLASGVPYVIRQKMPKEGVTEVNDLTHGIIKIENKVLEDQILLKSDGFPTYNFANVIDDHLMEITHVIRGHEYLDQTAKYNLLYDAFGWEKPSYVHVAMVLGEDGQKLSKRNGDASFMDLYNDGYLPEAVVNYLVLLGWSPTDNQEIFTMEELIEKFDPKRISTSSSRYDVKKLRWMNSNYIKKMSDEDYLTFVKKYIDPKYDFSDKDEEWVNTLLLIYKDHISYGKEINEDIALFLNETLEPNEECIEFMKDETVPNTINVFKNEISSIEEWNIENISKAIDNTKTNAGVKGKMLYMPIRIQTTGVMHGPELPISLYLLGKETVIKRLSI